jgi:hypothetical protein
MPDTFAGVGAKMREHVAKMVEGAGNLFVVDLDKDALWKLYLDSFPAGTNEVFRERREHDCSACRHFIKSFGNVVRIKDNEITTIWDFEMPGSKYDPVIKALAECVRCSPVADIMTLDSPKIGIERNFEEDDNSVRTWEHFGVVLPERFVNCKRASVGEVCGAAHSTRDVFKRSLEELSPDAVASVLELIAQNSLYKGEEWLGALNAFQKHQTAYSGLSGTQKENYAWEKAMIVGPAVAKIRNHSIGTLLVDISKGDDLDGAVRKYEAMVAPSNYKRPKAIFTKKMLGDAEKTLTALGYMDSLARRHANLEDITINNILFANRDVAQKISGEDVLAGMAQEIGIAPKNFERVEEVPIAVFVSDILPTARGIEVLLENRHGGNLVSLIAPTNRGGPTMFKWDNGFSWAYAGNITDAMKQRVKAAGGVVDGVLRFSIQWNDNHDNENDFDAHCVEPNGNEIYYRNKGHLHNSTGMLDVDIISPSRQTPDGIAVENITWADTRRMPEGTYRLFVHNYRHNGGRSGFSAEVELDRLIRLPTTRSFGKMKRCPSPRSHGAKRTASRLPRKYRRVWRRENCGAWIPTSSTPLLWS